mmetsp:Transcript_29200/g.62085  ORF Transcript_29200/g.62085 Transcript_29200/m.62085 type:complete len:155 (+) Transcript_29200:888-1352(+)
MGPAAAFEEETFQRITSYMTKVAANETPVIASNRMVPGRVRLATVAAGPGPAAKPRLEASVAKFMVRKDEPWQKCRWLRERQPKKPAPVEAEEPLAAHLKAAAGAGLQLCRTAAAIGPAAKNIRVAMRRKFGTKPQEEYVNSKSMLSVGVEPET